MQVNTSLREAARHCWRNRHFRWYVFADLAFFYTSAMIQTALPFYLTVCGPSRSKAKSARRQ